jgi:hypothetical protein
MRAQKAIRGLAVAAIAIAPLAAMDPSGAAVNTGDATANGPGVAFENTGGNVEIGTGHSESKVVVGSPESAPAVPTGLSTLATPAKPVIPSSAALVRARALVDAARLRAQAQIDAARLKAAQAVEQAKQQADDARSRSQAQSDAARSRSDSQSASASSSR